MESLTEYLEQYALVSLEKQDKFSRLIGEHTIELDIDSGVIRFISDRDRAIPFQVLGTESANTLTWLWAWSDEQPEIPANLLSSAFQLKEWGERHDVREFSIPSIDLSRADGQMISLIASKVCNASCYYRDPYEGGSLYVLLFDPTIDAMNPFDRAGLFRNYLDLNSLYDVNYRNALLSYFRAKGLKTIETGRKVTCELESGGQVIAEFDDSGRLQSLNGEMIST